jgi:hypothetical protein
VTTTTRLERSTVSRSIRTPLSPDLVAFLKIERRQEESQPVVAEIADQFEMWEFALQRVGDQERRERGRRNHDGVDAILLHDPARLPARERCPDHLGIGRKQTSHQAGHPALPAEAARRDFPASAGPGARRNEFPEFLTQAGGWHGGERTVHGHFRRNQSQ